MLCRIYKIHIFAYVCKARFLLLFFCFFFCLVLYAAPKLNNAVVYSGLNPLHKFCSFVIVFVLSVM